MVGACGEACSLPVCCSCEWNFGARSWCSFAVFVRSITSWDGKGSRMGRLVPSQRALRCTVTGIPLLLQHMKCKTTPNTMRGTCPIKQKRKRQKKKREPRESLSVFVAVVVPLHFVYEILSASVVYTGFAVLNNAHTIRYTLIGLDTPRSCPRACLWHSTPLKVRLYAL